MARISGRAPNGLEMSRPASASIVSQTRFAAAGRVGSIELLGIPGRVLNGKGEDCASILAAQGCQELDLLGLLRVRSCAADFGYSLVLRETKANEHGSRVGTGPADTRVTVEQKVLARLEGGRCLFHGS